ncbi:MAG TPA: HAD-IC family P-type ATPase [Candidatus Scatomorpha merdavium]|nr:HAD-IC family P-type ATPase [Candidatus Scatomorpha merdavium]
MTFKELLERIVGGRFSCSGGCCGAAYTKPHCGSEELEFDVLFIVRLIVSCAAFAVSLLVKSIPEPWPLVLLIVSAIVAGYDILAGAVLSIIDGKYLDKAVLLTLSAVLAMAFGAMIEGTALLLLYQIGNIFIEYAYARTQRTVLDTIYCEQDHANVLHESGEEERVPAESVQVGEQIIIKSGERVPCDCIVLEGQSSLDRSALGDFGGELLAKEGDELLSGSLNRGGQLRCEVTSTAADSAARALYNSVEHGAARGEVIPKSLSSLQMYFAPAVTVLAIFMIVLLPLLTELSIGESVRRAAMFLVIANPCSLFIAIPLIRLSAMGGAAKAGILFDGCNAMDSVSTTGVVAFDKAGTLSEGSPKVVAIKSQRMEPEVLLKIAAHALAYSNTAQARSIIAAYGETIYIDLIENFVEIPGSGVEVRVDGIRICVGCKDLMTIKGISVPDSDVSDDLSLYISIGDEYAGRIVLSDTLKQDAETGVAELKSSGMDSVILFTAESRDSAARTASALGIAEYYSECDREKVRSLLADIKQGCIKGHGLMYVGSGESFAGSHTAADIDVAMTSIEALTMPVGTDITIFGGNVDRISLAIAISRYAKMLTGATLTGVGVMKLILLVIAGFGFSTLWFSAFIDAIVAVAASLVSIMAYNGEIRQPKKGKHEN